MVAGSQTVNFHSPFPALVVPVAFVSQLSRDFRDRAARLNDSITGFRTLDQRLGFRREEHDVDLIVAQRM